MIDNPYQILNGVLLQLKDTTEKTPIRLSDAYTLEQLTNISNRDRTIIFEKLEKDGFISNKKMPKDTLNISEWVGWYITFDGIIFLDSDGYVQQQIDKNKLQSSVDKIQKQQFYLTLVLAVSGIIASLYYLRELFCR